MISFFIGPSNPPQYQTCVPLILITLFLILSIVQSKILAYSESFTTINGWQVISNNAHDSRIITCGTSNVLFMHNQSPVSYSAMYFKTFEIQPHYKIEAEFNFWTIDYWNYEYFIVYYDTLLAHASYYLTTSTTNLCEDSNLNDQSFLINFQYLHYGSTVSISLLSNIGKLGISDFKLYIHECPAGCNSCNDKGCFYQFLYMKSFDSRLFSTINANEGWSTNDIVSTLVGNIVDISYHKFTGNSITKEITLIQHEAISIYIRVMVFNSDSTKIYLKIDDVLISTTSYTDGWLQKDTFLDYMTSQYITIQERKHINLKIKITIDVAMIQKNPLLQTWFGIRDFQIFLTPYNQVADMKNTCDDSNIYPFDGCFSKIYDCVEGCSNCIFGVCYECERGWEYVEPLRKCYPICGDSVITYNEECDITNVVSNGCEFCKFFCSSLCKTCEQGKCLECQQSYLLIDNSCFQICEYNQDYQVQKQLGCYYQIENFIDIGFQQHDLLISNIVKVNPDCLVNNYQIFAFQYQICSVFRVNNCKIQHFEYCTECMEGYHLERNKKSCISSCNDGIIAETEECDDKNNIQFDKCYKCQQSCQFECRICIKEKCLTCFEGWQIIDDICVPKCGDGIIALGSQEQCDDGNEIDKDGCNLCMWQCSPYCKQCINQYLCDKCIDNFELIGDNECKPICGDNIVILGFEECDDGNELPFDGCFECQYQCEIDCVLCEFGDCLQSCKPEQIIVNGSCKNESDDSSQIDEMEQDQNEIYNQVSTYSIQECGDGRKSQKEECDDGNDINNDGCSNICQIEANWNCTEIQNAYSKCFPITILQISFLNQSFEYQYVQISYDKQVKTLGVPKDFISTIKSEISPLKPKEYQIKIYPVNQIQDDIAVNIDYEVEIIIYNSLFDEPKLTIAIQQVLIDENQFFIYPNPQSVLLKHPKFMNNNLRTVSQKLLNFSQIMMISLSGSGFLMLILGYSMTFLQILDILQYQSTLRFINLDYPQNVEIYFESSDFVSLQPILIYLQMSNQFDEILGQEYIKSFGRFLYYKTNADLLTNIQGQLVQLLAIIVLFPIHYFQCYLQKYLFTQKFLDLICRIQNKFVAKIVYKFYHLNRKLLHQFKKHTKEGFIVIFLANSWDLLFKVLLYISSNSDNQSDYRTYISKGICLFYLVIIISFLIQAVSKVNKFWQKQSELQISILLIKKLLFLVVLIELQKQPLLQTCILAILMSIYVSCILLIKKGNQNSEFFIIISTELSLITFTLLGIAYCQEFSTYFSPNTQITIGFVQITALILGLVYPLFTCFKSLIQKFKKCLNQRKSKNNNETKKGPITTNIFISEDI